jgi:hypothetical protein
MVIAGVIIFCVVILILAFLVPRASRPVQSAGDRTLGAGQRAGGKAPGPIGTLLSKSFGKSQRAADKSHNTGKSARDKLPF